jgi:hypothetical protein
MLARSILQPTIIALALAFPAVAGAQAPVLVEIKDLTPREHRLEGFVLSAPQSVLIEAVGAEPAPAERRRGRRDEWWEPEEERDVWPAACWILNARTREVVWDLRTARTERSQDGLHHFKGSVTLPAGVYEAHYGSFVASWVTWQGDGSLRSILRGLSRRSRADRYGGPYVDDGTFREFELVVRGEGRPARSRDLDEAVRAFSSSAIAALRPAGPDSAEQFAFALQRPTDVELFAQGELRGDGEFDYAWIMNADTRARVWTMSHRQSEPAGGAQKNRVARETLRLPAGRYVAYYVTDGTHHPGDWNAVPPFDTELWGLTLRVADAGARAAITPFVYEPVPAGQTIVSLTGIGDDEHRSEGFALRQPLEVRIYAIGEATGGQMHDYAWIVDARSRQRVWTMTYDNTEHAGGADKNRLFDGTIRLEPGSYVVHYRSDGSHSAGEWNAARPSESRYWGVSVFPASGRLERSVIGPFERAGPGGAVLAELMHMGDDESARLAFKLDRETIVQVHALGEGSGGTMYDYAWIEIAGSGRVVWEMTYRTSEHAGGADKNRLFDGTIRLPAGSYVLRYESDGSHSYEDWNSDPPDDPESWGVTLRRSGPR